MARYFCIMSGLRGCYMPDSHHVIKVDTRRELKSAIEDEVRHQIHDCDFNGGGKKVVAWAAAQMWRGASQSIIPFGKGKDRPYSIEIASATREEWKEAQQDM